VDRDNLPGVIAEGGEGTGVPGAASAGGCPLGGERQPPLGDLLEAVYFRAIDRFIEAVKSRRGESEELVRLLLQLVVFLQNCRPEERGIYFELEQPFLDVTMMIRLTFPPTHREVLSKLLGIGE
jgi:hypothetical protein